jgi:hypothetical protein
MSKHLHIALEREQSTGPPVAHTYNLKTWTARVLDMLYLCPYHNTNSNAMTSSTAREKLSLVSNTYNSECPGLQLS